jgi:hypothetical protein
MTREDIIRMADAAKLIAVMEMFEDEVVHFSALVAAAEREAEREAICPIVYGLCISDNNAQEIVNAIRARGSK